MRPLGKSCICSRSARATISETEELIEEQMETEGREKTEKSEKSEVLVVRNPSTFLNAIGYATATSNENDNCKSFPWWERHLGKA